LARALQEQGRKVICILPSDANSGKLRDQIQDADEQEGHPAHGQQVL